MKRILLLLMPLACLFAGCKFDDSDIWDELNTHNERIAALESLTSTMNINLSTLQGLVNQLKDNVSVTSVKTTANGYIINFSDGTSATISNGADGRNGQDGQNGQDGLTPVIGVKADTDGIYYWTLNGEWLLDSSGKKISTGVTPQVKIVDDQWMISYDNGSTWSKVEGQPTSLTCVFKSVSTDAQNAYFTLSDGTVITVPLESTARKLQLVFDESVFAAIRDNEILSTAYTIIAADDAKVDFETFESDGWTVTIYPTDERTGRISIKSPEKAVPTKILFLLTDDKGGSFTKIIKIDYNDTEKPAIQTDYTVDAEGGELIIPVTSCTGEINDEAKEWAEIVSVGDQVVLNIKSNESYDWRNCDLTLEDGTVIHILQITKDALILSSKDVQIDGRRQQVPFAVNTNVYLKATVIEGSDWLRVTPTSRALDEKIFTLVATRNNTEEERIAKVVFSGNELSDTCTVTQAVYEGSSAIDVTEAIATEEGDEVEIATSQVVAKTTDGYIVSDGESFIFVADEDNAPAIGDSVNFGAVSDIINGLPALGSVKDFTTVSTDGDVKYPSAADITAKLDSYEATATKMVSVTGDLTYAEGTGVIAVSGATSSVTIYNPIETLGIEKLDGHNATVTGFYLGAEDGTVYLVAVSVSDNGTSATTITDVIGMADKTTFTVKEALVVAKSTVGLMVTDGTSVCYLYQGGSNAQGNVGDIISINGTKTTYGGIPEITIEKKSDVQILSSNNEVTYPQAKDINQNFDAYTATTSEYITFTGDLVKSGNYYNITVAGASSHTGSIANPVNTSGFYIPGVQIADLSGHNVTVTGYLSGFTSSNKFVSLVITGIVDNGKTSGGDTPGGDTPGGEVSGNTITFADLGIENSKQYNGSGDDKTIVKGTDFSVYFGKGSNDGKYYTTGSGIRTYGDGYIRIESSKKTITKIVYTFHNATSNNAPTYPTDGNYSVSTGSVSFSSSTTTWTGSASSVILTRPSGSGHWRLQKVEVTFAN